MDNILFDFGFWQLKWYSFLTIIAYLIAIIVIFREAKRFKINKDFIFNLIFWTVIFGYIGARSYYVLFNWDYYSQNLSEIYKVWHGGLAIHGGLIGGFLTILIYSKKSDANVLKITDLIVPGIIIAQAIGRWGNFFNSEAHGVATTIGALKNLNIPDFIIQGMYIDGIYYQPTFLYESLWCLMGFVILIIIRRFKFVKIGQLTSIYFMWYSVGRFLIEASRTDSLMFAGFKVAQIASIALFIGGLIGLIIISFKSKFEDLYNEIGSEENIKF